MALLDVGKNLWKKYPFVYKIEDEFYYIGSGVFSPCPDDIVEKYKHFLIELKRVDSLPFDLYEKDVSELVLLFSELRNRCPEGGSSDERNIKRKDFQNRLNRVVDQEKEARKLTDQVDIFVRMLDYQDGDYKKHPYTQVKIENNYSTRVSHNSAKQGENTHE